MNRKTPQGVLDKIAAENQARADRETARLEEIVEAGVLAAAKLEAAAAAPKAEAPAPEPEPAAAPDADPVADLID